MKTATIHRGGMTKRKFHKSTLTVVVLSENPLEYDDLGDVAYLISEGDCSGQITNEKHEVLNGKQMAQALIKQGSGPEFFGINEKGEEGRQKISGILRMSK
jgi:hypothetical protein